MSFREINIAVRAENRASFVFRSIGGDIISLGHSFGLLDSNMGRAVSAFMSMTHLLISLKGVLGATTTMQAGYTAATGAATVATQGLGIALSSLFGPIGLILGLATAMGALAWASNQAADSERRLREELEKLRPRERTVSRAGEEELRRGID